MADLITHCEGDVEQALLLQRLQDRGPDHHNTDWATWQDSDLAEWTRMDWPRVNAAVTRAVWAGNLDRRDDPSGPLRFYRVLTR